MELAKSVCGYRADEDDQTVFIALERAGERQESRPDSGMSFLDKLLAPFRHRTPGWPEPRDK